MALPKGGAPHQIREGRAGSRALCAWSGRLRPSLGPVTRSGKSKPLWIAAEQPQHRASTSRVRCRRFAWGFTMATLTAGTTVPLNTDNLCRGGTTNVFGTSVVVDNGGGIQT